MQMISLSWEVGPDPCLEVNQFCLSYGLTLKRRDEVCFHEPFLLHELLLSVCQVEKFISVDLYDISGLEPSVDSEGVFCCFWIVTLTPD
jgi:hypothetical protein